jgi:hypothetical protein
MTMICTRERLSTKLVSEFTHLLGGEILNISGIAAVPGNSIESGGFWNGKRFLRMQAGGLFDNIHGDIDD